MRSIAKLLLPLLSITAMGTAAPAIVGIFNAASWAPAGMANGNIAQGSIFVVTGSGLGPATLQQATSYPLPTTQGLGGTTIQVTIGSQGFAAIMIYSSASQVAAVLPSRTLIGNGILTLAYQGSQITFPIQVVAASFALFTVNQRGSGPGIITDTSYQYKPPTNAARAGDTLVAWGTGLGGTTGDETEPPPQVDLKTGIEVFVGGQSATVSYGGRGSSPGLDQINFVVPAGVTGCYVSVAMLERGVVGNFTTVPIAPAGQNDCSDPVGGFDVSNLLKFQSSGALRTGVISLQRNVAGQGTSQDSASAAFETFNDSILIGSRGFTGAPSPGSCITLEILTSGAADISDPVVGPGLDAGTQLSLTGPNGTKTLTPATKGFYSGTFPAFLDPGTYTVANGTGGADVGAFKASLSVPQPINWTNIVSANLVPRSQDLLITWSGGGSNDLVAILGTTSLPSTGSLTPMLEFLCTALASAGQFSVPSLVLSTIPNIAEIQSVPAFRLSLSDMPISTFTASGLDVGYIYSLNFVSTLAAFQ